MSGLDELYAPASGTWTGLLNGPNPDPSPIKIYDDTQALPLPTDGRIPLSPSLQPAWIVGSQSPALAPTPAAVPLPTANTSFLESIFGEPNSDEGASLMWYVAAAFALYLVMGD